MVINTEWYRTFMYAAQLSNLTKAAQKLHMTQPSVSYAIKQLEEALGVILFDRLSKGVKLTQEGQLLLGYVSKAFTQLSTGEKQILLLKQFKTGHIRIGASGAIIKDVVLPILDRFHYKYPEIRIRFLQEKTNYIINNLKDGNLDIGFIHLPLSDPEIEIKPMKTIQDCFVVGRAFQDIAIHSVSTEELTQIPLLLLSPGSTTRHFLEQWFSMQGFTVQGDIELNSIDMLIEFALRGYGAAFVSRSFINNEIHEGTLLELKTKVPIPTRHIGVATKRDTSLSLSATTFMDFFLEE